MNEPNFISPEYYVNWLVYALLESDLDGNTLTLKGSDNAGKNYSSITLNDGEGKENKLIDGLRGISQRMKYYESEYFKLKRDSLPWKPASEVPDGPCSSVIRRIVQVDSGALRYISMLNMGWHDLKLNKWFVLINGKPVEHAVEQWRHFACPPGENKKYEEVKDEVNRLKDIVGSLQS